RIFLLYGAAGAGKSELLKWLETRIGQDQPSQAPTTIRIARTELDVLRIAERFRYALSQTYFDERTRQRWEEARRKPRTFAKLLVLTALERLLDSDDAINAVYYRLLNVVQPNLERGFAAMASPDENLGAVVELFTREDLARIQTESAVEIVLEYETMRHGMLTAFRDHLLEGLDLPATLGAISTDLAHRGVQPILLIDDLVQSLNLFASDLMDYFITLDGGQWDVVAGLTPASFEDSARGRELLNRIAYLDTIDDRVQKLWLSDIQGHDSYFLTEATCAAFTARYLAAYRAGNGQPCASCPQQGRCAGLGAMDDTLLAPFNEVALRRVYRRLPDGKGKARYFIRRLRDVLETIGRGVDPATALRQHAAFTIAVDSADPALAHIAEVYGPLAPDDGWITLPGALLAALGFSHTDVTLPAEPLQRVPTWSRQQDPAGTDASGIAGLVSDEDRMTIKAWLDGDAVNRQSLTRLRRGLARWIRTACPVESLHAEGIARPRRALRWRMVYLGIRPPIALEGVDDAAGIPVARAVGHAAFMFHHYAKATGEEAQALAARLADDERALPALWAGQEAQARAAAQLETQVGLTLDELALALYVFLVVADPATPRLPGFDEAAWETMEGLRVERGRPTLSAALAQAVRDLYDDRFKLRDNVYDGPRPARLLLERTPSEWLEMLSCIETAAVDRDYELGKALLRDALMEVQDAIQCWQEPAVLTLSPAAQAVLDVLLVKGGSGVPLSQVSAEVWSELQIVQPNVYALLEVVTRLLQ
ncbi:MAG: hypothetical protein KKA73_10705, partial [Chloroflexi bacterium]|nr:hypothetical protein [Chloroflexota bacterium]